MVHPSSGSMMVSMVQRFNDGLNDSMVQMFNGSMMVSPLFRLNDGSPTQNQDPCTIAISNLGICERVTITYTITNTIYIIENDILLIN